jgi:hypothetical protein
MQAYIGIMSRQGVEVICREHPDTTAWLRRQAERIRGAAICFWSVIPEDDAAAIHFALEQGCRADAASLLRQRSRDMGALLPIDDDHVSVERA